MLNFVVKAIVNPNETKADPTGIYPPEVADNVPHYMLFSLITLTCLSACAIVLIQPFVSEEESEKYKVNLVDDYHTTEEGTVPEKKVKIFKAMFSFRTFSYFMIALCSYCKFYLYYMW